MYFIEIKIGIILELKRERESFYMEKMERNILMVALDLLWLILAMGTEKWQIPNVAATGDSDA